MVGKHCMCWHDFRVFIMLSNTHCNFPCESGYYFALPAFSSFKIEIASGGGVKVLHTKSVFFSHVQSSVLCIAVYSQVARLINVSKLTKHAFAVAGESRVLPGDVGNPFTAYD